MHTVYYKTRIIASTYIIVYSINHVMYVMKWRQMNEKALLGIGDYDRNEFGQGSKSFSVPDGKDKIHVHVQAL